MEYIVCKRYKQLAICGSVNLGYQTICNSEGMIIYHDNKPLCSIKSQDAYDYFSRNDDGNGLKRYGLVGEIMSLLKSGNPNKELYDKRWDAIWSDEKLDKFKREEYSDFWVWNFEFYNADIEDLEYIKSLILSVEHKEENDV